MEADSAVRNLYGGHAGRPAVGTFRAEKPKGFIRNLLGRLTCGNAVAVDIEERQRAAARLEEIRARLDVLKLEAEVRGRRRKGGNSGRPYRVS